jgi:hypothetical protein
MVLQRGSAVQSALINHSQSEMKEYKLMLGFPGLNPHSAM